MARANIFVDRPSLALRYENEARAETVSRLQLACWLAILLVPLFSGLDAILHPHLVAPFLLIRLVMVILSAGVLVALRTPAGQQHAAALSFFVVCQVGFGIVLMSAFSGGGSSPYYAGVNLVMLAAGVLIPWESGLSAAAAVALVGAYTGVCLAWAGIPDIRIFTANLFFLVSTGLIMVLSHRAGTRTRRREFLQRVALEESGRHRDEFLANITHELRTPLAAILGFCDMLEEYMTEATDEHKSWLARIRENALTLYRLIVQLLDFSRMEAGAMNLRRERFAADTIVTKVGADMRAIAGASGVPIGIEIAADAPPVIGDPARVEEIVTNLAANALKFSGGRPIVLGLRRGAIAPEPPWHRIVPDPEPEAARTAYAEIAVVDDGEGISLDDLYRLFVAFQQVDGSTTRRQGGVGLGLAISARLAAAMHGHIAVRSTPGAGSTFALLLPVADSEIARRGAVPSDQ